MATQRSSRQANQRAPTRTGRVREVSAQSQYIQPLGKEVQRFGTIRLVPIALFLAAFVLNGLVRLPLPLTLLIVAPLAFVWAWPRNRAAQSS